MCVIYILVTLQMDMEEKQQQNPDKQYGEYIEIMIQLKEKNEKLEAKQKSIIFDLFCLPFSPVHLRWLCELLDIDKPDIKTEQEWLEWKAQPQFLPWKVYGKVNHNMLHEIENPNVIMYSTFNVHKK